MLAANQQKLQANQQGLQTAVQGLLQVHNNNNNSNDEEEANADKPEFLVYVTSQGVHSLDPAVWKALPPSGKYEKPDVFDLSSVFL